MTRGEHPIWGILKHRGLPLSWLAKRTDYSHVRVRTYSCGMAEPTPEFRQKAAYALDLPEWTLFNDATVAENTAPAAVA